MPSLAEIAIHPHHLIEIAGYIAAALVLATFCMRTMLPLRLTAIASNLAFIAYGAMGGLMPILVLHGLLLPLNVWRLLELRRMVREAEAVRSGDFPMHRLMPHMKTLDAPEGTVVFRRGDEADRLYVLVSGAVRIESVGVTLEAGAIFGEVAMFSLAGRRSQTATCTAPTRLLWVDRTELTLLFTLHPSLAFHLMQLATGRLLANEARLTTQLAEIGVRTDG